MADPHPINSSGYTLIFKVFNKLFYKKITFIIAKCKFNIFIFKSIPRIWGGRICTTSENHRD